MMTNTVAIGKLASAYVKAKTQVLAAGYGHEIIWQRNLSPERLTECMLLKECAWVILSSGMRESVVRLKFPFVSKAFFHWSSAKQIVANQKKCEKSALAIFRHERKVRAISRCAEIVHEEGFDSLRRKLDSNPIGVLQQFPYIGPATSFHLAKNIGFCVAKPDRHLRRLTKLSGYRSPSDLCHALADYVGDPIPVVDLVLWRFAVLRHDYMISFLTANPDA